MNKKVKVLECIRQGQIGGGESHLLVLVENMDRARYEPVVLSFTDGPMIDRLREMQVPTHIIPTVKPFDARICRQVREYIRSQNVDLIHVHGTRAGSNVLWAARSLKIPVIYTVHGWSFHPDQHFITRKIRIMGERYISSRTNLNISVSESNKQSGRKFLKGFESIVVSNGIDQKKFNPANAHKDIRKEFGIDSNAVLLLFLARMTSHKQPLALIEAFSKVVDKDPDLHLMMVGDGDQKNEVAELVKKYKLEQRVTLVPFRLDVPDIIAAADIYILPSLWEGLPIALLEAMAMGKAVIGSNVDGTSEVIKDQENGLLVDPNNLVNDLQDKILKLGADKEMRKRFSEQAIRTIDEEYNAINMTRTIESLYDRVLQQNN